MAGYGRDQITVKTGGDVGIGTSTPSNAQGWNRVLDVHGENHSKILITTKNATVRTGIFSHSSWGGSANGRIGTESNHDLRIMAGYGKDQITVKTNGNVGIGTTNPAYTLEVNGTVKASVLKSTAHTWSDFVFEDGYELISLEKVQKHIKEFGHLPGIPSEKEVTAKGIDLAQMDAKLLQKIEELTLYTIAQEEKLEHQNFKIEKLEKENAALKSINSKLLELQKRLEQLENRK